nr:hypothetical protein Iba_chr14fCG5580 [Ipomoea batatas]
MPVARSGVSAGDRRGLPDESRCSGCDRQSPRRTVDASGLVAGGKALVGDHVLPTVPEAVTGFQLETQVLVVYQWDVQPRWQPWWIVGGARNAINPKLCGLKLVLR